MFNINSYILTNLGYKPFNELLDTEFISHNGIKLIAKPLTCKYKFTKQLTFNTGQITWINEDRYSIKPKTIYPYAGFNSLSADDDDKTAYEKGFFVGDGSYNEKYDTCCIYLYKTKQALKDYFPSIDDWRLQQSQNRLEGHLPYYVAKDYVPLYNTSLKTKLDWLAGYLDSDGSCTTYALKISSTNLDLLRKTQLLLWHLRIYSVLALETKARIKQMPLNDGTNDTGAYHCKDCYRLLINKFNCLKLAKLGLKTNRVKIPTEDVKVPKIKPILEVKRDLVDNVKLIELEIEKPTELITDGVVFLVTPE